MNKNFSGQTLLVIVAIMIISLGIGIASASRLTGTLRSTVDTDMSARAFSVAEGSAEQFLAMPFDVLGDYIDNDNCDICTFSITGADGVTAGIQVDLFYDGNTTGAYPVDLPENEVAELNLQGYSANTPIQICINEYPSEIPQMIYYEYLYGVIGSYQMDTSILETPGCHTISGKTNPVSIRLRSVYAETQVEVVPDASAQIPSQGIIIESTATINSIVRKVRVLKGYNTLPTDFSYTLFQKSLSDPLSN